MGKWGRRMEPCFIKYGPIGMSTTALYNICHDEGFMRNSKYHHFPLKPSKISKIHSLYYSKVNHWNAAVRHRVYILSDTILSSRVNDTILLMIVTLTKVRWESLAHSNYFCNITNTAFTILYSCIEQQAMWTDVIFY